MYFLKRILAIIPVLLAVSTLVFFLHHSVPGGPADYYLGEQASASDRSAFLQRYHLDLPLMQQYGIFLKGLCSNDWGESFHTRQPVLSMIRARMGATFLLTFTAMAIAIMISIPAGVLAAVKKNSWLDSAAMFFSLIGISIPNFWMGPVLALLFSIKLGWLPLAGHESFAALILPSFTLGAALAAMLARITRSSLLEELHKEYVTTARAKGLSERKIIFKHALRNALNPVVTIVGLQVGTLLAGAIITEKIFDWPGIGSLLLTGIQQRDYNVVQGCIIMIAFLYVSINTLTDVLYKLIDPRVRLG